MVAMGSIGLFVILLIVAHRLAPDVDPSTTFMSELARGPHGWVMQGAFFALAAADGALLVAIEPWLRRRWGRVGTVLFLIGTVGVVLAGAFVTDPVNTPPEAQSTSGRIHNLGGGLGLCGFLGTVIFSLTLLRCPAWRGNRLPVASATAVLVLGFLFALVSIATIAARHGGIFGPDTPVGWPNRIGILTGCLWILVVAWHARRLPEPRPSSEA